MRCFLCPHHCGIAELRRGICGVRENEGGKLYTMNYGKVSSAHVDPIEKKPLFHFKPGQPVFSMGSVGCTFRCQHCQNYTISMASLSEFGLSDVSPEDAVRMCDSEGCRGIAFTYNEPTIWHEYTVDVMKLAKERGLFTVYVTNGWIESEPLEELSKYLDASNIDIKAFTDEFYSKTCKAHLDPVLRGTELAFKLGIHIELTYLIIPTKNDEEEGMKNFCEWVSKSLSPKVPVHFSRFHPDYMMRDLPSTPIETMEKAWRIGKDAGLEFVYLGNVSIPNRENTYCPKCGTLAIERTGFWIRKHNLQDGKCAKCGEDLYIVP